VPLEGQGCSSGGHDQGPADGLSTTGTPRECISDSQRDSFLVCAIAPVNACSRARCISSCIKFTIGHVHPLCSEHQKGDPRRARSLQHRAANWNTDSCIPRCRSSLVWPIHHADQTSRLTCSNHKLPRSCCHLVCNFFTTTKSQRFRRSYRSASTRPSITPSLPAFRGTLSGRIYSCPTLACPLVPEPMRLWRYQEKNPE
jgi:hypothetical protein